MGVVAKLSVATVLVDPLTNSKTHMNCQCVPAAANVYDIELVVDSAKLDVNALATVLVYACDALWPLVPDADAPMPYSSRLAPTVKLVETMSLLMTARTAKASCGSL